MEFISVNPENVRAGGNVLDARSVNDYLSYKCTLSEREETINGVVHQIITPVYSSTYTVSLVVSPLTVGVNESLTCTATVKDDNVAKSGVTVVFYENGVKIGESVTNSNGETTFTYNTSSNGELYIMASAKGVTSDTVTVSRNINAPDTVTIAVFNGTGNQVITRAPDGAGIVLKARVFNSNNSNYFNNKRVQFWEDTRLGLIGTVVTTGNGLANLSSGVEIGEATTLKFRAALLDDNDEPILWSDYYSLEVY